MATVEQLLMAKGPDVIVADSATTALEAARLMAEAKVGFLIVRDGEEVRGVFTERDLLVRVVAKEKDPSATPLRDVMTTPVESCRLTDTLAQVAGVMAEKHIRHLVVMEDGAVIGVIGVRDVLAAQLGESAGPGR